MAQNHLFIRSYPSFNHIIASSLRTPLYALIFVRIIFAVPNQIFIVKVDIILFVIYLLLTFDSLLNLRNDLNGCSRKKFQEERMWNNNVTSALHAPFEHTLNSIILYDLLEILLPSNHAKLMSTFQRFWHHFRIGFVKFACHYSAVPLVIFLH